MEDISNNLGSALQKAVNNAWWLDRQLQVKRDLWEATYSNREHEKVRASRKHLRLSEREYQYLELLEFPREDIPAEWGYRRHELENRINEKIDSLPTRFRILADDIEALSWNNYLESEAWLKTLDDIAFIGSNRGEPIYGGRRYDAPPIRPAGIGELFGNIAAHLVHFGPEHSPQSVYSDLVWGFTASLLFEGLINHRPSEKKQIAENVLEGVYERNAKSFGRLQHFENEAFERYQQSDAHRDQLHQWIRDILEEHDIEIRDPMLFHIVDEIIPSDEKHDSERTEELIEEYLHPKNVIGAVVDLGLAEETRLTRLLFEDADRLRAKSGRGIDVNHVLEIANWRGPVASSEIARAYRDKPGTPERQPTAGVTELARDLAGERDVQENPGREIWSERPILIGDKDGWDLTPYGTVLYEFVSNDRNLTKDTVTEELIEQVFVELEIPEASYLYP